jgi:outer membrane protein OmpA-like peptidoglycan-associated protein
MKKELLVIALLLVATGLFAQMQTPAQYSLTKLDISGLSGGAWGAVSTESGELIFTSGVESAGGVRQTRLYMLVPGDRTPVELFKDQSKDFLHMGSPYVTPDGRELYFAVSGHVKVTLSRGLFKTGEIYYPQQIARSVRNADGSWGVIEMFRHNSDRESSGDPWLSPDGQQLYFASNRSGGQGGIDLWRSHRTPGGDWSIPENLKGINSKGDERSPRFDSNGNFYFASTNGSLGGLDIFSCAIMRDGHFAPPVRMASPLNSTSDDFAITFISENSGYISSNRTGVDAIYQFERISRDITARITVVDYYDGSEIADAQIYLMSELACDSKIVTTDAKGVVEVKLDPGGPYTLLVYREGFLPREYRDEQPQALVNRTLTLEPLPSCFCPEEERLPTTSEFIDRPVRLPSVHFDLSRWQIRADAARELDKLVVLMKDYPQAGLEIAAYTDCRGSDTYNLLLSQRRANAVRDYLIRNGVAARRIKATGYGKSRLLNRCDCQSVDCSDQEHELNRRAEYTLITH